MQKWRENIFKLTNGIESLHEDSSDNIVRVVNLATSKNVVVKSTFISTAGPLLMGTLTTRLITY
jgi:hypothetical protein